jgi:hypothetical protein
VRKGLPSMFNFYAPRQCKDTWLKQYFPDSWKWLALKQHEFVSIEERFQWRTVNVNLWPW